MASDSSPYFTYVFPCVVEDFCKVGFSRDPLSRIGQFHRRWFEFFDLDVGVLVGADTQREARDLELALRRPLKLHRAPMPLTIESGAGGKTEWLRGAMNQLSGSARSLADQGFEVLPLKPWLRERLEHRSDALYEWAEGGNGQGQLWNEQGAPTSVLIDTLDAYRCLEIDIETRLPDKVWDVYRQTFSA